MIHITRGHRVLCTRVVLSTQEHARMIGWNQVRTTTTPICPDCQRLYEQTQQEQRERGARSRRAS